MENEKFKEIIEIIEALHEEMSPCYLEMNKLREALNEINREDDGVKSPLGEIIVRITRTARRHDLSDKAKINIYDSRKKDEVVIGTNHQGLGYQDTYSSQLTPLVPEHNYSQPNEQGIRDILFDDNSAIELTSIVKKSNQKTLLKTIQILKKYNLVEAFKNFKADNLEIIEVGIGDTEHKIVLDLSSSTEIDFSIMKNDDKIADTQIGLDDDGKVTTRRYNDEDEDIFKDLSNNRYGNFSLNEVKTMFLISQHKDEIIKAVQEKTKLLNNVILGYNDEKTALNNILQPILALEKL